jgi:hypothetical protein
MWLYDARDGFLTFQCPEILGLKPLVVALLSSAIVNSGSFYLFVGIVNIFFGLPRLR